MSALPEYGEAGLLVNDNIFQDWQINWTHLLISLLPPVCSNQSLLLNHHPEDVVDDENQPDFHSAQRNSVTGVNLDF